MSIFYCPNCKSIDKNFKFKNYQEEKELTTWVNIRDGYGRPIRHIICPQCGYLLSGVMNISNEPNAIEYVMSLIDSYTKENKDGGYIKDGHLNSLIQDIAKRKNIL